ncbi:hypothetical protein M413DRAFT_447433 [Hebeloma cylindrosporum]|uniref:Uncharacterized protein n=1 Tax=Hebeloma cylindrosporum TaxID=76867 RepID=A0A0C2YDG4_HEBCY|nr:hypothetical protein M413DRAFT_447433 [Hebeloma cylindrosporum h7]
MSSTFRLTDTVSGISRDRIDTERLPADTAKLFDRDPETNEVLWFASPPLSMPRTKGPRHSLAYMQFLAAKRKRASGDGKRRDGMDVDAKAGKCAHPQTVTEITTQVPSELPLEAFSLKL